MIDVARQLTYDEDSLGAVPRLGLIMGLRLSLLETMVMLLHSHQQS